MNIFTKYNENNGKDDTEYDFDVKDEIEYDN